MWKICLFIDLIPEVVDLIPRLSSLNSELKQIYPLLSFKTKTGKKYQDGFSLPIIPWSTGTGGSVWLPFNHVAHTTPPREMKTNREPT